MPTPLPLASPDGSARRLSRSAQMSAFIAGLSACSGEAKDSGSSEGEDEPIGGPSTVSDEEGRFTLLYETNPSPIPLSADFTASWTVESEEALDGLVLNADAWMPEHGHGMNTTPSSTGAAGSWETDGLLFHMPGDWEFVVELSGVGASTVLRLPYSCCEE